MVLEGFRATGPITPLLMHVWLVAQGASEENFSVFMKELEFPWSSQQKCSGKSFLCFHSFNSKALSLVCFANEGALTLEVSS